MNDGPENAEKDQFIRGIVEREAHRPGSSPMREQIIVYFCAGETELNEVANIAVSGLAEGKRHAV